MFCLNLNGTFLHKNKNTVNRSEEKGTWSANHIVAYSNESCHQHYHYVPINSNNYIFQVPQFKGMTCFKIAHHKSTDGLWSSNPNFKYSVMSLHPIYIRLQCKYGLDLKKRKREEEREEESSDGEEGSDNDGSDIE